MTRRSTPTKRRAKGERAAPPSPARSGDEQAAEQDAAPHRRRGRRGRRSRAAAEFLAAVAACFLLTVACFSPAWNGAFVSDDVNAIVENENVTGDLGTARIWSTWSWWGSGRADSRGYRPSATTMFALEHAAFGPRPSAFRTVNFVLHALCCGLVFTLGRTLGLRRRTAAGAAVLFAVLPIHSEAVIWIVGRAELGAAAGFLLAALLALRVQQRASLALLLPAAAAVAIGMTFKENAVTVLAAPAAFFLGVLRRRESPGQRYPEHAARRRRKFPPTISRRRTLYATGALAGGVAAALLLRTLTAPPDLPVFDGSLLDNPLSVVGAGTRLLGSLAVLGRYVALTVWPSPLSIDYSYDALGIGPGFVANLDTLVAVVFLAACAFAASSARNGVVAVGLLLAAASYSIVSNTAFVLGTILGERLFYLPTAGLCLALAASIEPLASNETRRRAFAAALAVVVAAFVLVCRDRSADWRTPAALFGAAVEAVPRSARARMEYGTALGAERRFEEAAEQFRVALEILPDYAAAAYNQGNMFAKASRWDDAAASYRRAIELQPKLARAWHNLALTERYRGNAAAWIDALERTVALSPGSAPLANELGEALIAMRRYDEAVRRYDALIERFGESGVAYFNRAVARHHLGGCPAAVDDYRRATRAPSPPREAFVAAAGCLRELGNAAEAASIEQAGKVANRDTRR